MAVIFKITFAVLALCAIAYAFPEESTNTEAKQEVSQGVQIPVEQPQVAETKAHEQHSQASTPTTAEEAHSRHKRGCKTVSYQKNGRTITAQKC